MTIKNILPLHAEEFNRGAIWWWDSNSTVTITAGQPDPDGGNNAYRVNIIGGGSDNNKLGNSAGGTVNKLLPARWQVQYKCINGSAPFKIYNNIDNWATQFSSTTWDTAYIQDASRWLTQGAYLFICTVSPTNTLDLLLYHPMVTQSNDGTYYTPGVDIVESTPSSFYSYIIGGDL